MSDPRGGWTSASSAEADQLCPGRHFAQRGVLRTTDKDAEFGIAIHSALATSDVSKLSLEQRELVDSCEKITSVVVEGFFGGDLNSVRVIKEQRFWIKQRDALGEYMHSARVDRVYYDANKALIIEFKSLPGDVAPSPFNAQLRDQAMLICGNLAAKGVNLDMVACVVVQPLVSHSPEVCIYRKEDLQRAEAELHERVVRSNNPASPRVPGEIQCKFCRAKPICSEYQSWVTKPLPMLPVSIVDTPISKWTGDQCAVFLDLRGVAGKFLTDTYGAMKKRLRDNPGAIPGYFLRDGNEVSTVTDPQGLLDRLTALTPGINPELRLKAFMKCVDIGNSKFEEVVHLLTGLKGKKLDDAIKGLLKGLVSTKKNDSSIVKQPLKSTQTVAKGQK